MGAVFRDLNVEWGGRRYVVTPSNRLLRRIEGGPDGVSLIGMSQDAARGQPKMSQIAYVVAVLLQSAGCEVTEDEVLAAMTDPARAVQAGEVASLLIANLFPAPDHDPEKPAAPRESAPRGPETPKTRRR